MNSNDSSEVDLEVTIRPDESSILNEFQSYMQEKNTPRKSRPLTWWAVNHCKYPHLADLARKYLSAPMASIASEREFKIAKRVTTNRYNLKPGNVEQLLFLKYNLGMTDFKY